MNVWKSELKRPPGVWTSEIRLKEVDDKRKGKVNKLLALLREPVKEAKSADVL